MPASVWRGHLAFGMVSIPVRLFKAARRERTRFHNVYRPAPMESRRRTLPVEEIPEDLPEDIATAEPDAPAPAPIDRIHPVSQAPEPVTRIRNLQVDESTQKPVQQSELLKGFEIEKDRYVTFAPQEVAALRPKTSSELTIAEFVRLEEIDPLFFETSYYLVPDNSGEKPYALLYRALAETGYAAIGSVAMHGREHATAIRPGRHGLILHTLFYANEVRADEEYHSQPEQVTPKELDLARQFVRLLAVHFDPQKLKDTFEERLQEMIRARSESATAAYKHGEVGRRQAIPDIMEALKKSLEMARKPPQTEKAAAKPRATRGRSR